MPSPAVPSCAVRRRHSALRASTMNRLRRPSSTDPNQIGADRSAIMMRLIEAFATRERSSSPIRRRRPSPPLRTARWSCPTRRRRGPDAGRNARAKFGPASARTSGVLGWIACRPGADRRLRRCDRGPAVHPCRSRACATTPFGGTIAHGFPVAVPAVANGRRGDAGARHAQDGGQLRVREVRFLAPVRSGKRVRGRFTLDSWTRKAPGQILLRHRSSRSRSRMKTSPRFARNG
jgi:hypothetical protein